MMRTIVLLLFLFGHSWSYAQQWCVPGATWYYSIYASNHYRKYVYTGDTLIDGVTGNVIRFNVSDGPWINPTYVTRAEDDVIYEFQDFPEWDISRWDTIIWFGAAPGDHWDHLEFGDWACWCPFNVVDTGHVDLGGQWLRTIDVRNPCFSENNVYRYIERIGSVFGLFFNDCYDTEFYNEPMLRCYSDEGMSYASGLTQTCDWGVGLAEQTSSAQWSIHPASEDGIRILGLGSRGGENLRFVDAAGRTAMRKTVNSGDATLDVSPLVPGSYIVQPETSPELVPLRWMKH